MNSIVATVDDDRQSPLNWLRDVLVAILEVAPLPRWVTKMTIRFVQRVPDWLLAKWATAVHVNFEYACLATPDLANTIRSEAGKAIVNHYVKIYRVVPTVRSLKKLVQVVVKLVSAGMLPASAETIQNQIAALALARCTGREVGFAKQASSVLNSGEDADRLICAYQAALHSGDELKVKSIDGVLIASHHGRWVAERLKEIKRWLRGGSDLNIRWEIDTLPDNGGIYRMLLKGGKKDES